MRLITLGDIHGNIEALKSVIEDSINSYGNAIDGFVFLGDYVCDFLEGEECIQLMMKLREKYPVYAINGNRETGMAIPYKKALDDGKDISWDIDSTMGAPLLSMRRMSDLSMDYIVSLDDKMILNFENADSIYIQHKMPLSEDVKQQLKTMKIKNILTAHTHESHIGVYDGFNLFNPGSVGLTDSGIRGADYGVMTYKNGYWLMEKRHVDYDYEKQIEHCKNNTLLMEKCKNWGKVLVASIQTGINVAALYMFEKNRIAKLYSENPEMSKFSIEEIPFGIGRYGNVSPINTYLEENVVLLGENKNSEIHTIKYKTDNFTPKVDTDIKVEDWMYDVALDNVLKYIEKFKKNELEGLLFNGRMFH